MYCLKLWNILKCSFQEQETFRLESTLKLKSNPNYIVISNCQVHANAKDNPFLYKVIKMSYTYEVHALGPLRGVVYEAPSALRTPSRFPWRRRGPDAWAATPGLSWRALHTGDRIPSSSSDARHWPASISPAVRLHLLETPPTNVQGVYLTYMQQTRKIIFDREVMF